MTISEESVEETLQEGGRDNKPETFRIGNKRQQECGLSAGSHLRGLSKLTMRCRVRDPDVIQSTIAALRGQTLVFEGGPGVRVEDHELVFTLA